METRIPWEHAHDLQEKEKQVDKLKKGHEKEKEEWNCETFLGVSEWNSTLNAEQLTVEVNWLKKIWFAIKAFPKEKG